MPTENANLRPVYVAKADMALSQLTSGGVLVREQLKKFLLVKIKASKVLKRVRVTTMQREQQEIPKMTTFGSRVWYPGVEMEELPIARRSRPGFDKVTLTSYEIMAQVNFPRYFLKAQVEMEGFRNTLLSYLALHGDRDFDDFIINGDTTNTTDDSLALHDGLIAGTTSNTYAAGTSALSSDILDRSQRTMPDEYAAQEGLVFWTSRNAQAAYRRELKDRGTGLGDSTIAQGNQNPPYGGIPVEWIPMFPTTLGIGGNETDLWHGDPKQFIFALHEQMEMETEYNIKSRSWTVVMTARKAQGFEHEPAGVLTTGLLST